MTVKVEIHGAKGKVLTNIEINAENRVYEQIGLIWDKAIAAYSELAKDEAGYQEDHEAISKQADGFGIFGK